MKIPNGIKSDECTGCRACEHACPKNCIRMNNDPDGFQVPTMDNEEECIHCNICKTKCHIINDQFYNEEQSAYGLTNNNKNLLLWSTSGGAFSGIASEFLKKGGWVYGSVYDDDFRVVTTGINKMDQLKEMCGSKYVLNDTLDSYLEVKEKLEEGKKVLFCGVPCQVAGLKGFLGKDFENLYLIDLLCHGGPSPKLFRTYLDFIEKKFRRKIKSYTFRDKRYGWRTMGTITFEDGLEVKIIPSEDPYCSSFYSGKTYRASCYQCKYARKKRVGDITVGDFWGVENYYPDIDRSYGISAIIVNSQKGGELMKILSDNSSIWEISIEEIAANNNETLNQPTTPYVNRDKIYGELRKKRFKKVANKYLYAEEKWKTEVKKLIPAKVKEIIRKAIKR